MTKEQNDKRAVALYYDGETVPKVTAGGSGDIAETIIAIAEENGIPLREDAELVALLAELDLGEAIPEELYQVVAEVIAFAYLVTGKFPKDWDGNS